LGEHASKKVVFFSVLALLYEFLPVPKKSLFHAGAFVSDGILAASSRVALAKVDLRSRELINRSVLPHKHLDGLRSVLFVHPMPDFATSTLSLSNVAVTAPYWLLFS
jgi:hypothetical protein